MTLTRTEENPFIDLGDVRVPVRDDAGHRIVVRVDRSALDDADGTVHPKSERIDAMEAHWSEIVSAAERKHSTNDFEAESRIGILSADIVPRPTGPTRFE